MQRILIFGNSGSGKTTMATARASRLELPRLELDLLAWASPGVRRPFDDSLNDMIEFIKANQYWVMEGCYGSLVSEAAFYCTELRFLNPGVEACLGNNLTRPWEPQKYDSEEQQNRYLEFLQDWAKEYGTRDDEYSLAYHRRIFDSFRGAKTEYCSLQEYRDDHHGP